ncbi:16722_t:CDS:2 [Cetraspora pellucida]|uniref:16722_t:CDS:1 n=1 Tax=Cetraspora pellucida TaxID=1433469 RepID=A0A9N9E6Y0_9GLOM|nr:16722_t:CDS:2 [Cetraspora pellucida]
MMLLFLHYFSHLHLCVLLKVVLIHLQLSDKTVWLKYLQPFSSGSANNSVNYNLIQLKVQIDGAKSFLYDI